MGDIYEFIDLDFEKAQTEFWIESPDFYVYAWRFIRSILLAIDMSEDNSEDNISLINNNVYDEGLRNRIHAIRIRRNEYEHKSEVYSSPDKRDFNHDLRSLNQFVDYINKRFYGKNFFDYQFNEICQIKRVTAEPKEVTVEAKEVIAEPKGITFEQVNETKVINTKHVISLNNNDFYFYKGGYNSVEITFRISQNKDAWISNPVFAVIHNILIRNKKIRLSSYLKEIKPNYDDLGFIFMYEMLILNAARTGALDAKQTEYEVAEEHEKIVEIAIRNIAYWESIINKTTDTNSLRTFTIKSTKNLTDNSVMLYINNIQYVAEIINNDDVLWLNPMWIDRKINYVLTKQNYQYYQLLLYEIFGLKNFKEGQYIALNEMLKLDNKSVMIILPTGYGKSLIYQFLACLQPQLSIVISPSHELIYDQLTNLNEMAFDLAGELTISEDVLRFYSRYKRIDEKGTFCGKLICYLTPNDILNKSVLGILSYLDKIKRMNIITIDECHHMSIWGHKFESEFFTVTKQLISQLGYTKKLLCSATASTKVKQDLQRQIGEEILKVVQPVSLDRGHINYKFIKLKNIEAISGSIVEMFNTNYSTGTLFDCSVGVNSPRLSIIVNNNISILKTIYVEMKQSSKLKNLVVLYAGETDSYLRFRAGRKTILLCTEEYLYGINIKYLINIIFIGYSPSKEWFYQQTGRVGRQGQESNVINYLFEKSSKGLDLILNSEVNEVNLINILLSTLESSFDLSNTNFVTDDVRNEEVEKELVLELFDEIRKKVYVSSSFSYGRLRGKMDKSKKTVYDFALYVMFIIGIIKEWIVDNEENDMVDYIFGVDMKYESNTLYFEENAITLINELSASDDIQNFFTKEIVNSDGDIKNILSTIIRWFIENTVGIKRQMFLNQYQLSEDAATGVLTNNQIEMDLDNYFMGNTYGSVNSDNLNSAFDEIENFDIVKANFAINLSKECCDILNQSIIKPTHNERLQTSENENEKISEVNEDEVGDGDEDEHEQNIDVNESSNSERYQDDYIVNVKSYENEFIRKYEDYFVKSKHLSSELISEISEYIKIADLNEKYHIKAYFERQIENKKNFNYTLVLCMFELLEVKQFRYFRLKEVINNIAEEEIINLIMSYSDKLMKKNKLIINNLLVEKGYDKLFYKGVFGFVKKIFEK